MLWLPTAKRENRGGGTWAEKTDPKGCLHTTETSGWPSYGGWKIHPHVTIMPVRNKGIEIRQHMDFGKSGMALRNLDGGVQTNRDYVFQFELIGTCDKKGPGYYWPDADDTVLLALYDEVIYPLSKAYGIPITAPKFLSYPESYGQGNPNRFSGTKFDNYSGWLGHQHVPENSHGDPGAFPWARMMALVAQRDSGLDMDAKEVYDAVWKQDAMAVPAELTTPDNPTWMPQSILREAALRSKQALDEVVLIRTALGSVGAQAVQAKNEATAAKETVSRAEATARRAEEAILKLIADLPDIIKTAVAQTAVDVSVTVNGKEI